jgi:outer membrane phospholipase A
VANNLLRVRDTSATQRCLGWTFWCPAGSEAPRRFAGVGRGPRGGVAASLCHRTPKWPRLAAFLCLLLAGLATCQEPAAKAPPDAGKPAGELPPADFFKAHFFGYEPFYFVAGPDSPNAKFQISFKYRVLNSEGALARHAPPLTGLYFGYTQTSLWDWRKQSAPFLDTSYKPELLYELQNVDRGKWGDWLRLDLQAGVQHESNGRDGAASRSLNLFYLRPTVVLGAEDRLQFTLSPRAWVYLPDLEDNPDLERYRGYVDLRATLGWAKGVQLSSTVRAGNRLDRGSVQLDLTYPLRWKFTRSFSVYLHAQYFTGYGESFLLYNQRSSAYRFGLAIYR